MLYGSIIVIKPCLTTLKIHRVAKKEAIQLENMGLSFTNINSKIYIENYIMQKGIKK